MSTLSEIETAVDSLSSEQKQELLLYLAGLLRDSEIPLPKPRVFPPEQIGGWIAEDENDMRRLSETQ